MSTLTLRVVSLLAVVPGLPLRAQSQPSDSQPSDACASITGHCITAEGHTKVAGARVVLDGTTWNSYLLSKPGSVAWKEPDPVVTDEQGRFVVRFLPPAPPFQLGLAISAEGRAPRTARWREIRERQSIDLGEIELWRGHTVRGTVKDQKGQPVPKAWVTLGGLPQPIERKMDPSYPPRGQANEQGEFTIGVPIPRGTWPVAVQGDRIKHVDQVSVVVHEDRGAEPLNVVVATYPTISGIAVDERGAPIPYARLEAIVRDPSSKTVTRSNPDGTFTVFATEGALQPVALEAHRGPNEPWRSPGEYEWGSKDVRIELTRSRSFELTVVEKETGKPVEGYSVRCHAKGEQQSWLMESTQNRLGKKHEGGRVVVDHIWRGDHVLLVVPDAGHAFGEWIEIHAADAPLPPLRVELERYLEVPVAVRFHDGAPAAGSQVELWEPREGKVEPGTDVPDELRLRTKFSSTYRGPWSPSCGWTDSQGRATLFAPRAAKGLVLRIRSQSHLPALVPVAGAGGAAGPQLVEVSAGGVIEGTLGPAAVLALRPTVNHVPVGPDGSFRIAGLPPGECSVTPYVQLNPRSDISSGGVLLPLAAPERVKLEDGGKATVKLDASAFVPATLDGIVTLDGKAPANMRIVLLGSKDTWKWEHYVLFEPTGRFHAPNLVPGLYRVKLASNDHGPGPRGYVTHEDEVELGPGKTVAHEFRFKKP